MVQTTVGCQTQMAASFSDQVSATLGIEPGNLVNLAVGRDQKDQKESTP